MKKLLLVVLFITFSAIGYSQALSTYVLSYPAGSLVSIAGTGTVPPLSITGSLSSGAWDDASFNSIPIGFNFTYVGVSYNSLSANSNGYVVLGQIIDNARTNNSFTNTLSNASGTNQPRPVLAPYWDDLFTNGNPLEYTTTGPVGSRVFTLQWSDMDFFAAAGYTPRMNCQLILYEGTNVIDFVYERLQAYTTASAGIGITDGSGAAPVTGAVGYWSLQGIGATPAASQTTDNETLGNVPNNRYYRWSPCPVTVAPTNNSPICAGGLLTLTGTSGGGAIAYQWDGPSGYSSNLQNNSIPGITAAQAGTYTFTATDGTCSVTATTNVVVTPVPGAISGTTTLCAGTTTTLSNPIAGGTWTSGNTSVATVVAGTGVVSGFAAGTSVITYANNCGSATATVTVNAAPGPITGIVILCPGSSATLSNSVTGGTWSASNTTVATITSGAGVVTGASTGNINITYTLPGNCTSVAAQSVNTGPPAFTISPASASFCSGSQMLTAPAVPGGSVTNTYNSTSTFTIPDNTPAGITNGIVVSGIPAGATIVDMSVNLDSVAMASDGQLSFNIQSPNFNNLNLVYLQGGNNPNFTSTVISSLGGTAFGASAPPFTGTYNADMIVPTGPSAYQSNINSWSPLFPSPNGTWLLCARDWTVGQIATVNHWSLTIHYTTAPGGYTWSPAAGLYTNPGLTVPYIAGTIINTVYASPSATTVYTATATLPGIPCTTTSTATINITGSGGGGISGNTTLCIGASSTLSTSLSAGTWSSSNTNVATVTSGGVVTGASAGTAVISYNNGCVGTALITVNPPPPAITGTTTVCATGTTTLTNTIVGGGTWTSATTSVATVDFGPSNTAVVSGITQGTSLITFTSAVSGCTTTTLVTVKPMPGAISGAGPLCVGGTMTLSNAASGGTWTSGTTTVATITPGPGIGAGVVTGVGQGTSVITYTNGCASPTVSVTVIAAPGAITGSIAACTNTPTSLSNTANGGTWTSVTTTVATINSVTGVYTGTSAGTSVISYTTGCGVPQTTTVTISSRPQNIFGTSTICLGTSTTLSNDGSPTGTWSSSNTSIATVNATTGDVFSSGAVGTTTITAANLCGNTSVTFTVASPTAISGNTTICQNATTILSNGVSGGTWTSGNTSLGTIDPNSGVFYGNPSGGAGSVPVTYTITGGCFVTTTVTTTIAPGAINGLFGMCEGQSTALINSTPGGVWSSSNTGIATLTSSGTNATVYGAGAGNVIITYAVGTCTSTATVTVNAMPAAITGPSGVCVNSTITLNNTSAPGFWTSSNTSVATVDASGVVTGVSGPGTSVITYALLSGCNTTRTITVTPVPAPITGNLAACAGQLTPLSDISIGGTWGSSTTSVATISAAGVVGSGISASGTTTITYTLSGCSALATFTVNPLPLPIAGPTSMCSGSSVTFLNTSSSGTWSSSNSSVVTVDITTGAAGAVASGAAVITYTLPTGCISILNVTVNQTPASITGNTSVCVGATTNLSNTVSGGTWTSATTSIATIDPTTGVVTGISQGNSVIVYTRLGCSVQTTVTVNPLPSFIVGPTNVCVGSTATLTDLTANGTWSSSNSSIAPVGMSTGIVSGFATGVAAITYMLPTGCYATTSMTVNPLPANITGNTTICAVFTTSLSSSSTGGTWSSSTTTVATVGTLSGVVTGGTSLNPGGTTTITYSLNTGCFTTTVVTVNPLPGPIIGSTIVCAGSTIALTDASLGGTWSSSNSSIANVTPGPGAGGGIVTGVSNGTARITYTVPSGCISTISVSVNALPTVIGGTLSVCAGSTTQLSNGSIGGIWSSSNSLVASVNSSSGLVTGGSVSTQSTAVITYTAGTGCSMSTTVTVNPLPASITGNLVICAGLTSQLSDATPNGTWSSNNGSVTIGSLTGFVVGSGVAVQSTSRITYTLAATGCTAVTTMTVNPLPAPIGGLSAVCEGSTINLSNATAGGTWSSTNTTVATVVLAAGFGVVTGGSTGGAPFTIDTIVYTLSTGCLQTKTVSVNQQPGVITGGPVSICQHTSAYLSDAIAGGVWSSANTNIATIDNSGLVTGGNVAGTTNITYTLGSCRSVTAVQIKVQPGNITGNTTICNGAITTLSNASSGGGWSSSITTVAVINGLGGVTSIGPGTTVITYNISGCFTTTTVTVNVQPSSITGNNSICNTNSTTLSNSVAGGAWSSANTNIAVVGSNTGIVTGTGVGSVIISYIMPGGCFALRTVNVAAQPVSITGIKQVCIGATTQLSNTPGGGVWSVDPSTASIATVTNTGIVTGLTAGTVPGTDGTAIITYSLGVCYSTTSVTVHPPPSQMTGSFYVCQGQSTTLGDLTPGGVWSTANAAIATVDISSGIVYGANTGTTNITYMIGTGCYTTHTVTVIASPAPISGAGSICVGGNTQLSDITFGGVWTSSNSNVATINPATGFAGGVSTGAVIVTYVLGSTGCRVVWPLSVNPFTGISGPSTVCIAQSITLNNATVGGAWSSGNTNIATVNAGTGVVTGVTSGGTLISYTLPGGCIATVSVSVAPQPLPITGPAGVCLGQTITLSDATPGGVWNSSNIIVADVSPFGDVTGNNIGTAVISYTAGGCPRTTTVTVYPIAAPITGNTNICLGLTSQLSDATAGGIWTSTNTSVATVGTTGLVTSVSVGSTTIIYTPATGCLTSAVVNVNPLPGPIIGNTTICLGATTQLSDTVSGGAWYSSSPGVAIIDFITGLVTGVSPGVSVISYQVATGCIVTDTVLVNPLPVAVTGPSQVCVGSAISLFSGGGTGTWASSNTAVATVNINTGVVTGITAGTVTIIYTLSLTGCSAAYIVTVNPPPPAITGIAQVCSGMTTQLFNAIPGGTWSSSNTYVGTIDLNTGVTGSNAPATSSYIVTYTLPTGCFVTDTVIVTTPPAAIAGPGAVCVNDSITLSNSVPGGIWSSLYPGNATVSATGTLYGVSAGFTVVTYTMGGGNCFTTHLVNVNPVPAPITGGGQVCHGLTTTFTDATSGGAWSSQNTPVATIGSSSGVATGINSGPSAASTIISYTLPTGCYVTTSLVVNPLPLPITGNTNICVGGTRTLSDAPGPGVWSSGNTSIATIDPISGVVTGVNYSVGPPPGTTVAITNVTYTINATGCIQTTTVAVHPLPQVYFVTGGGSYCSADSGVHVGLSGSEIGVQYFLYLGTATPAGPIAGTGGPLDFGLQMSAGNYTVVAMNSFTTCSIGMTGHATVSIIPSPVPAVTINTSTGTTICAGTPVSFTPVTVNGGTSPAFDWYVNGVHVSSAATYNFVPANGDVVTVKLTSNAVCANPAATTGTVTITVLTPLRPSVDVLISPNDTICVGTPVTFTAIPTSGGTAPVYYWTVNNAPAATGVVFTYTPYTYDVVYVTMVSNYMCSLGDSAVSNIETITTVNPVIPDVTIVAAPGALIASGIADTLIAHVVNGVAPTYQWYMNGTPVPGATDSVFISNSYSYPRPDSVGCLVKNTGFCSEQTFGWIYVVTHPTGVTQVAATFSDISVIPNPSKGIFVITGTLNNTNDEEVAIELTDVLGQTIYKNTVIAKRGKLDSRVVLGNTVANGMYMLNVRTGGEQKVFHMVIEQ